MLMTVFILKPNLFIKLKVILSDSNIAFHCTLVLWIGPLGRDF